MEEAVPMNVLKPCCLAILLFLTACASQQPAWERDTTPPTDPAGITLQPAEQMHNHITTGRLFPLLSHYQTPAKTLYFIYPAARRQVLKITLLGDFLAESLQSESEAE